MKRLFLEIDSTFDTSLSLLKAASGDNNFELDTVITDCGINMSKTWEAVMGHDEIYFRSSLLPQTIIGIDSPSLFDNFLKAALHEGIKGKKVYCCNPDENIRWSFIDESNFKKVFKKDNEMYTLEYEPEITFKKKSV